MKKSRIAFLIISILFLIAGVAMEGNTGIALFALGFLILFVIGIRERYERLKRRMEG